MPPASLSLASDAGGPRPSGRPVVVIGDDELTTSCVIALQRAGVVVEHHCRPDDRELLAAVTADLRSVVVVTRDDVEALRLALLVEHARPGVPLVVTVFDRTVGDQLRQVVPASGLYRWRTWWLHRSWGRALTKNCSASWQRHPSSWVSVAKARV